jgi:anti-anti-sigma regulatory factor
MHVQNAKPLPQIDLYASSTSGFRAQAVAAADDALNAGSILLVLGLDCLTEFNDAAASATIVALRKLREVGGSVRLVTDNADHLIRLEATGLDRIFEIVPTEPLRAPRGSTVGTGLS